MNSITINDGYMAVSTAANRAKNGWPWSRFQESFGKGVSIEEIRKAFSENVTLSGYVSTIDQNTEKQERKQHRAEVSSETESVSESAGELPSDSEEVVRCRSQMIEDQIISCDIRIEEAEEQLDELQSKGRVLTRNREVLLGELKAIVQQAGQKKQEIEKIILDEEALKLQKQKLSNSILALQGEKEALLDKLELLRHVSLEILNGDVNCEEYSPSEEDIRRKQTSFLTDERFENCTAKELKLIAKLICTAENILLSDKVVDVKWETIPENIQDLVKALIVGLK